MKTIFENFRIVALFVAMGLIFSCTKSDPIVGTSCERNAEKVSEAALAYTSDPTSTARCEAYKTAVSNFFKSCPTYYSGASKDALDEFLKTPCN
ncbi:hypothetical protein [Dyadobacter sp. LHD-138]|uniref:hypothetical protein n=1 Tax=Dyadobacter sp. LHD-138 TaxID=3071413 RepID=UPI0027E1BC25|nr:hypothetical protein [Dyadobacter sp. LHD-138]MDQ6482454.1 hypothetical protein [Dyadobacter sp. LHD-138]